MKRNSVRVLLVNLKSTAKSGSDQETARFTRHLKPERGVML